LSDPRKYWIGFNFVKGIGPVRFQKLLDFFGKPEIAWQAPPEALREAGLGEKIVDNVLQARATISLDKEWEKIQQQGITVFTWEDDGYPHRLNEIDQPPPVLYVKGDLSPDDEWPVAIVGTRRVTAYGRQVTDEIAGSLSRSGVTIISGMARGVDGIAHKAALSSGGRTIAVLGSGVDWIYPPEHRALADQIIEQGALISDYAPGTPPEASNFPARNRIISGLSMAVVVTEAGQRSGALITASFAADQGRDVFAVPGSIKSPQSRGTNRLIQDGAYLVQDSKDVLEVLSLTMLTQHRAARVALPADEVEAQLFQTLGHEPMHIDEIGTKTELPIEKVAATLALMELKGMVRQVGGMNYVAVRESQADYE
jgi:DNA processing protein